MRYCSTLLLLSCMLIGYSSAQTIVHYAPGFIKITLPPGWKATYGEQDLENPSTPPSFVITPEGTERGDGIPLMFSMSRLSKKETLMQLKNNRPSGKGEYGDTQEIEFDIYANPATKLILSTDQDFFYQAVIFSNDEGKTVVAEYCGLRTEVEPFISIFDTMIDSVRATYPRYSEGHITADNIRVRGNPTTTAKIIDVLPQNTPVRFLKKGPSMTIEDLDSSWFFISYGNDRTGWIYGFYIQWTGK